MRHIYPLMALASEPIYWLRPVWADCMMWLPVCMIGHWYDSRMSFSPPHWWSTRHTVQSTQGSGSSRKNSAFVEPGLLSLVRYYLTALFRLPALFLQYLFQAFCNLTKVVVPSDHCSHRVGFFFGRVHLYRLQRSCSLEISVSCPIETCRDA